MKDQKSIKRASNYILLVFVLLILQSTFIIGIVVYCIYNLEFLTQLSLSFTVAALAMVNIITAYVGFILKLGQPVIVSLRH